MGTPTGETFIQDKFKFLHICDDDTPLRCVPYDRNSPTFEFDFEGVPSEASASWPDGRLVAGRGCVMVGCRSIGRLAFQSNSGKWSDLHHYRNTQQQQQQQPVMNFSDLSVWLYSPEAYVIPVWGDPSFQNTARDESLGDTKPTNQWAICYAVIQDEALGKVSSSSLDPGHMGDDIEAETEKEEDGFDQVLKSSGSTFDFWDPQSCLVITSGAGGSDGAMRECWDIPNSENFAPGMTWSGFHFETKSLIGWSCSGRTGHFRPQGQTHNAVEDHHEGDLYILEKGCSSARIVPRVRVSGNGSCICAVELQPKTTRGLYYVVCLGEPGDVVYASITGHRGVFRDSSPSAFAPHPICMCSTNRIGELAVLYEGRVEVYMVIESVVKQSNSNSSPGSSQKMLFASPIVEKCYSMSLLVEPQLSLEPTPPITAAAAAAVRSPCKFGGRISACPRTSDIYVLDEFSTVRVFERNILNKKDTLDKFFSGDNDTVQLNPSLQVIFY